MEWRCQKWAAGGYWAGVVAFAVSPNWTGLMIGWGITQFCALIAG